MVPVVLIGGAPLDKKFLRTELALYKTAELVCADGGARHVGALGLRPHVIIGDMDSLPPEMLARHEEEGCRIIRYPSDKKETDMQLALEYALRSRPVGIRVYGALGGRIDHTLANISLLALALGCGVAVTLADEWCEVFLVKGTAVIEGKAGQTVSLFPFAGPVQGIDLEGFAYPLKGGTMEYGAPYGISNRLQTGKGIINVASGVLLAVKYHEPDRFPEGR